MKTIEKPMKFIGFHWFFIGFVSFSMVFIGFSMVFIGFSMVLIGFQLGFIGFSLVLIVFLAPGGQVCKGHDYKELGLQRAVLQRARLQEAWCARTKPSFYRGGDVQHDKPESDRDSTREHRCIKSNEFTWFL